jgi:alpha-tubulin suppressor-like RCC1 family protein
VIGNVRELIVGPRATCVRQISGRVRCWGSAEDGALPLETDPTHPCGDLPCVQVPTTVPDLWDARGVALGALHGCAIDDSGVDDSGSVKCWGSNDFGELGRGASDADAHPEPLPVTLTSVQMIRAGDHHTCALQTNGRVYCWGLGASGQLGVGSDSLETCAVPPALKGLGVVPATDEVACSPTPLEVTGLTNVTALFAQGANTCARTSGGAYYCWGSNDARQLTPGSVATTVTSPVELKNAAGLAFALGAHHACTRNSEGAVRCWGAHDAGQLGVGSASVDDCGGRACRGTPTLLADLPKAKLLALGGEHSCATLESGGVRCWGSDAVGQLGDSSQANLTCSALGGSVPCQTRPLTTVHQLTDVHSLACGSRHCCAQSGEDVVCWGSNAWGQSSGFDLAPRPFPSKVYGLD